MTSGIYRITHIPTQRHYVGSSINMERRWKEHKIRLRNGTHNAHHLMRVFALYGEQEFEFIHLEECDCSVDAIRIERENFWIQALSAIFNVAPVAGSLAGYIRPQSTKEKMSAAQKARYAASNGSPLKGRPRTEQAKAAISAGKLGKPHAPQHLANLSAALKGRISPRKGIVMSQAQKDKISASKKLANQLKRMQNGQ